MSASAAVNVIRWLVWDTFRQAAAARLSWVMLAVSLIAILFCAGVGVRGGRVEWAPNEVPEFLPRDSGADADATRRSGVQEVHGELTLGFGAVTVPHARDAADSVHFIQLILAGGVAGTLGVLLALLATAGFVPAFLEPQAASILLTKPAPRWLLLLGKFLGLVAFVGAQAALFVGGTWLALGLATGVWSEAYLRAIPLLMAQFAFFASASIFLAAATRNTIVCVVGIVLFWLLCAAVNAGRIELLSGTDAPALVRWVTEALYWLLPKPVDFQLMLGQALGAGDKFAPWGAARAVEQQRGSAPELSLLTSLAFAVGALLLSARRVARLDY
jgi:hypothetical protein